MLPRHPGHAFRIGEILHDWSPVFVDTSDEATWARLQRLAEQYRESGPTAPEDGGITMRFGQFPDGRFAVIPGHLYAYARCVMEVNE